MSLGMPWLHQMNFAPDPTRLEVDVPAVADLLAGSGSSLEDLSNLLECGARLLDTGSGLCKDRTKLPAGGSRLPCCSSVDGNSSMERSSDRRGCNRMIDVVRKG